MEFTVEHALIFAGIASVLAVLWWQQARLDKAIDALRDSAPEWTVSTINTGLNALVDAFERELARAADRTKAPEDDEMVEKIANKLREIIAEDAAPDDTN